MSNDTTQQSGETERDKREAQVNHDSNGQPLGAAVFLGTEDIAALDIDPSETERVAYWVESGEIRLVPLEQVVIDE